MNMTTIIQYKLVLYKTSLYEALLEFQSDFLRVQLVFQQKKLLFN